MTNALDNLDIEYTYHSHNDSCYTEVPDGVATNGGKGRYDKYCCVAGETNSHTAYYNGVTLKSGKYYADIGVCNRCGKITGNVLAKPEVVIGYSWSWGTYQEMTCGKTEESIESVTIKY